VISAPETDSDKKSPISFACSSEPLPKTTLEPILVQHIAVLDKSSPMQIFHGNRARSFNDSSSFEDFRSCAPDAIKDFLMNSSGISNHM